MRSIIKTENLTCLSISEYTGVVAFEGIVEDVSAEAFEHCLLRGELREPRLQGVETVVEREGLWLFSVDKIWKSHYTQNFQFEKKSAQHYK